MRYLLAHLCPHLVILTPCPIVFLSVFGTELIKRNKDTSLNLRGEAQTILSMQRASLVLNLIVDGYMF